MVGEQTLLFNLEELINKEKQKELETENQKKFQKSKKGFSHTKPTIKIFEVIDPETNETYRFLNTYSKGDAIGVAPKFIQPFLVSQIPVGQTTYKGFGTKHGNISTFLLEGNLADVELARRQSRVKKPLQILPTTLDQSADADTQFNIDSRYTLPKHLGELFKNVIRKDVGEFAKGKEAKKILSIDQHFKEVSSIVPNQLIKSFESVAVVKYGKGKGEDICQADIGADISGGCLANTSSELIYNPKNKCTYCYAYQNGQPFINTMYVINEKTFLTPLLKLIGEKTGKIVELDKEGNLVELYSPSTGTVAMKLPRVNIRFGQTVECFVPDAFRELEGFEDGLANALELMLPLHDHYDIRSVIPSKTLVFKEHYVDLLKQNNTALFASVTDDIAEAGMVGHGFTTEKRLENLLRYAHEGVNANIYLAVDVGRPQSEWNKNAVYAWNFFHKHKDVLNSIQILDLRITQTSDAYKFGGASWTELKQGSGGIFQAGSLGKWHLTGNGYLASDEMHPEIRSLIKTGGRAIGGCYTHALKKSEKICSGCAMYVKTRK